MDHCVTSTIRFCHDLDTPETVRYLKQVSGPELRDRRPRDWVGKPCCGRQAVSGCRSSCPVSTSPTGH